MKTLQSIRQFIGILILKRMHNICVPSKNFSLYANQQYKKDISDPIWALLNGTQLLDLLPQQIALG
jgi:hypothetical protein